MPRFTTKQLLSLKKSIDKYLKSGKTRRFTPEKLLILRKNIDRYLKKNDVDYAHKSLVKRFKKETSTDNSEVIIQLKSAIDKLAQKEVKFPEYKEVDFTFLNEKFDELKQAIISLSLLFPKQKQSIEKFDDSKILSGLKSLEKSISKIKLPQAEFPESIAVSNFPVQKIAQPATNISINPLRGLVHTSATTVSTTLSTLPGYGVLANRRSLIFQNLSSTVDIYIGGSNVTAVNGYLLESGSVSPAFDSGPRQVWYGIASAGSADIRTIEIANTAIGG